MKICQVSSCFVPSAGGVETFVYNLSKSLVRDGHEVKVITSSRGKPPSMYQETMDGIEVLRYPEKHFFLETPLLFPIAFHVMKEDYDILHVHGMVPGLTELAILMGRLKKKPVAVTYHCDAENNSKLISRVINTAYNLLVKYALPTMADKVVATTSSYAKTSLGLSRVGEKLTIVPCGVGEEYLRYGVPHNGVGASEPPRLLYVGKLHKYKGVKDLLVAMSLVKREIPRAELAIIGDGRERERLEARARELGLTSNVAFLGWLSRSQLLETFAKSDLLILPSINSRREAFGIVILEGMALGKPVIASRIPGPESVIEDGKNGLLTPPESPTKLAEAIIHVLRNQGIRLAMGQAGREHAKQFSYDLIAKQYESLYAELLAPARSSLPTIPVAQVVQIQSK